MTTDNGSYLTTLFFSPVFPAMLPHGKPFSEPPFFATSSPKPSAKSPDLSRTKKIKCLKKTTCGKICSYVVSNKSRLSTLLSPLFATILSPPHPAHSLRACTIPTYTPGAMGSVGRGKEQELGASVLPCHRGGQRLAHLPQLRCFRRFRKPCQEFVHLGQRPLPPVQPDQVVIEQ
jgi:hypothetical protein